MSTPIFDELLREMAANSMAAAPTKTEPKKSEPTDDEKPQAEPAKTQVNAGRRRRPE
jgi:hypothetical protein